MRSPLCAKLPVFKFAGYRYASKAQRSTTVAIAGAGPVGLTLSLILSKYGIEHTIMDRASGPTNHPQV